MRLLRLEHLFHAPELDPFRPEHAGYDERAGVEQVLGKLRLAKRKATASVTVELREPPDVPQPEMHAKEAMDRYCRRKIALIDDEIEDARRFGYRTLIWGFLAVIVLNSIANAIDPDGYDPIAAGISVAAWVILWVPVNLLVYDLYYYRRDRRAYAKLMAAPLTLAGSTPEGSASGASAPR